MGASTFVKFSKIGALSATGTRPYADGADGFVMGEGAALFLLKRLEDAERDGDHIYAVLRGMGGSSDGKGKGITAPNPVGQKFAIQRAWENAGLSPSTASYVEGHGTSTRVGDVVEVESLTNVFASAGAEPGSVALGSVKSNIGHLKGAAGAAGMLKTVLALNDKVLPPSLHCDRKNPNIDFGHSPFYVNTELRDWDKPACGVRRAGVSAFGFGGTNFHAVLEEYIPGSLAVDSKSTVSTPDTVPTPATGLAAAKAPPSGVIVLGADTGAELVSRLRRLKGEAEANRVLGNEAPLARDLAAPERIAIDFRNAKDLARKIDLAIKALDRDDASLWSALKSQGVFRGSGDKGKVAFLYPGQGSQYVNMLAALRDQEPVVRSVFEQADRVMQSHLDGKRLSDFIFVDADNESAMAKAQEALKQTEITQPAVLAVDCAVTQLLETYGVQPDMVMGHSLGEYAALVESGVLTFSDALEAVSARGKEMARVAMDDNGKMAAVFAPLPDVRRVLASVDGYVVIANINSNQQAVIGGASSAIDDAISKFQADDINVVPLPVSHAFHTKIVAPASEPLMQVLSRMQVREPALPVISNVTGGFYATGDGAETRVIESLGKQIASPVQFIKGLQSLYDEGARVFVEVGPKKALKGFVDDVFGDRSDVVSLFVNHPKIGDIPSFNQALCGLYAAGHGSGREEPRSAVAAEPKPIEAPVADTPTPQTTPARNELVELFNDFVQRGQQILAGAIPAATRRIVISGAALGLPGTPKVFDDDNLVRILHGEQFIDVIPYRLRQAMAEKHITRLVKPEKGDPTFVTIDDTKDVVKIAGRAGEFDIVKEFGVKPERALAFDSTTALAVAVGLDALRDAGIPLVLGYKTTTTGSKLPDRWRLPDALRDETGVIFASAFPGMDAFSEQLDDYYTERGHREQLQGLEELRDWFGHQGNGSSAAVEEVDRRIAEIKSLVGKTEYHFDRRFLFRVLSMGHSQFAEEIGARGPNTQVNGACASTTQAVALAEDWIRNGRCKRVIIVSADNVTSDHLMEWVGSGFLASGAAATDENPEDAATPFDRRRHGMIAGMGAAALVVESEDATRARGLQPIAEVLGTVTANSAFHGTRLDINHISAVMEDLVADAERKHGIAREQMAPQTMFMSHETYTPARGGSASAEIHALRSVFGNKADQIVISNTKGFTGHAMGAGVEDVVAVKALETGVVPPVPNFKEVDPELGELNLSTGGSYPVQYALRLGAGFGSQLAMTLTRWMPAPDGRRRNADQLGFDYRIADRARWQEWLSELSGYDHAEIEIEQRRLRVTDQGPPQRVTAQVVAQPEPAPVAAPAIPSVQPAAALAEPQPVAAPEAVPVETASVAAPAVGDDVEAQVIRIVAEKTDYPPDMLDLDLDLEADLGVDTVKQAEVFAEIRGHYDIPRDENLKLSEFPTLAHVVGFVRERRPDQPMIAVPPVEAAPELVVAAPEPVAQAATTLDDVEEQVVRIVAEKTDYPPDMLDLDLDLEADLGVDTVKQAEVFAEIRGHYDIPRDENLQLSEFPTLAHVVQFVRDRRPDQPTAAAATAVAEPVAQAAPTVTGGSDDEGIRQRVLAIVAEMTGYPEDMLDMDLDLEADLGVDTVKQAEIFAAMRESYGIPRDPDLKLSDFPTLTHAVQFVKDRMPASDAATQEQAAASVEDAPAPEVAVEGDLDAANRIPRRVPTAVWRPSLDVCKPTGVELGEGTRVIIMPDSGGVGRALIERLEKRDVEVLVLDPDKDSVTVGKQVAAWASQGPVSGLYWLPALDAHAAIAEMDDATWQASVDLRIKALYEAAKPLYDQLQSRHHFIVAATRLGGRHGYDDTGSINPLGGGVCGFVKSLKRERNDVLCKVVDFAPSRKTAALAKQLVAETLADPGVVEVGIEDAGRWSIGLREIPCDATETGFELTRDTVFVVTGAAGSIVSAIVADLATASAGTFHLLDLAPKPDATDPDIARFVTDRDGLKREIFERIKAAGERATPAMVEKELARIERAEAALSAIEVIERAGGSAHYHSVDLTDSAALASVMEEILASHDHIDVLLHAAGVEISHFLPDKSRSEFDLVFDVKSSAWHSLMRAIGDAPLGAAVVFSSVAGRFGNGGQTDYAAANDFLTKCVMSFANSRPGTRGLAIDWTAWGGIGMATRGSIPTMMAAAGIDMLPPEAGIPVVRRELALGPVATEIVVGDRLGILTEEWDATGGIDVEAITASRERGPMLGDIVGISLGKGLIIETELDPQDQAFLYDHRIDGTPVLPGVMGLEGFAELATLLLPDHHVESIDDVQFLAPFKFYRDEPRKVRLSAQVSEVDGQLVAYCALEGERVIKTQPDVVVTTHFTATVRLTQGQPEPFQVEQPRMRTSSTVDSDAVYQVYFHGPAYQVLESAWGGDFDTAVGRLARDLPANHSPEDLPTQIAPRLIELCFQTAGMYELGVDGRFGLPSKIGRVTKLREPSVVKSQLYTVVRHSNGGPGFDADVVDESGNVYLRLEDYHTAELPGAADAVPIDPIKAAFRAE
jgi:malonyl CoA-acyl carrier protein transacylase